MACYYCDRSPCECTPSMFDDVPRPLPSESLVQATIDEVWSLDGQNLRIGEWPIAEFWQPNATTWTEKEDLERARQAALGHRALRLLAKLVDAECSFDGDCDEACTLVEELRGGK